MSVDHTDETFDPGPDLHESTEEGLPRFLRASQEVLDFFEGKARTIEGTPEERADYFMGLTRVIGPLSSDGQMYDFMASDPGLSGTDGHKQLGSELCAKILDPALPEEIAAIYATAYGDVLN